MPTEIYVCLDLGNDTLKVSFAYQYNGKESYGKLMMPNLINQVAFPAAAIYDEDSKQWKYADELDAVEKRNFSSVVKIKSLLSLVGKREDIAVEERNRDYYYNKCYFPKFSFPVRRRMKDDFQYLVDQKLVFEVPGYTPRKMCESFFSHVKKRIKERIAALTVETGIVFNDLRYISIVHPPKQGKDYTNELSTLVRSAFGVAPQKVLTSTQALGLLAFYKGYLDSQDRILLFDLGDETISVAKVWLNEEANADKDDPNAQIGILMDSVAGHSLPLEIGGSNIDEAIATYLEGCIRDRETVGSPSADKQGHIFENGLCSEQYLLMKDIKKAKMLMPMAGKGIFHQGVPISIHRETLVQRMLSAKEFLDCVGINTGRGVAIDVMQYVLAEMSLPGNSDVTKILFAGGMSETYGLNGFLKKKLSQLYPNISFLSFHEDVQSLVASEIQSYEASTYAASVGGAVVAMKNYSVDAALSFSYGTWLYHGNNRKHLQLFANRGALLKNDNNYFSMEAVIYVSKDELKSIAGDEMFSTIINTKEIEQKKYADKITYESGWLIVGDKGDFDRRRAEKAIDLRVVAGGADTEIQFYYRNRRVSLSSNSEIEICFTEGFVIDKNGNASPFFDNLKDKNANHMIYACDFDSHNRKLVSASEIEFRLSMNSITVATNI